MADARSRTVLLVEDDPNLRLALKALLADAGYSVRLASSEEAAIRGIRRRAPDVLLLDVARREADMGRLVARARRAAPDIALVVMTAFGRAHARTLRASVGSHVRVLPKPFRRKQFIDAVKQALTHSGRRPPPTLIPRPRAPSCGPDSP